MTTLRISARRLAVIGVLAATALVMVAIPASAGRGGGGGGGKPNPAPSAASMTLSTPSVWATPSTCAFDATYTWSGMKGRGYALSVKLYDSNGAVVATTPQVQSLPPNGDFTYIFSFNGAPGPQRGIYARGVLLSNGVEVAGTPATSPVLATTCGSPISVSWLQTFPLT